MYFLYTYYYNNMHVFSIVTGMFYYSYYYYKLTVIIICVVSSFMTGMFLFIHFFMQQHGYALHNKIMDFIRGSYLGSYHSMYACFTSHGTYSLTT
jgi:hypothetical protein